MSADYYVTCRNETDGRITSVRRSVVNSDGTFQPPGTPISRSDVVADIEDNGAVYFTAYQNSDGDWFEGSRIRIIIVNGTKYLRTDANNTAADNLDEIPEC